jgi:polyisoprenoid-binding protein YceI
MRHIVLAAGLILAACATPQVAPQALAESATPPAGAAAPASPVAPALSIASDVSLNPADAPAGGYEIDPLHASVIWRVRHTGIGILVGRMDTIHATLNFDPQNPANSQLEVTIAANSVSTGVLNRAGERAFDHEIAQAFGADSNPDITFKSTAITLTGATTGLITGDLTINGQTHPATLEASFHGGRLVQLRGGKYVLAFSGRTIIDRTQWGIGDIKINPFASNQVELVIEAEFVKS